jgi:transposase-like protein
VPERDQLPKTLLEATRYFADPDVCIEYVAKLRWPDGPACPRCGSREYSYLKTRRIWKCKGCKKQYSVKLGTIFEDSPIPLDKWLVAIWLIANAKNGISSHELGRALGITQKSAWHVLHRIRLAMQVGSFDNWGGELEVDESYIGGLARNMHKRERARKITGRGAGRGGVDKAKVVGVLQRGGRVQAHVIPDIKRSTLHGLIRTYVEPGATIYTDTLPSYHGLDEYDHRTINHLEAYVDGRIHTNGLENFWSLLKRGLHGTYISVQPFHLFRYLDERCFTFNERHLDDLGRFDKVLQSVTGRRLTYTDLTGKA